MKINVLKIEYLSSVYSDSCRFIYDENITGDNLDKISRRHSNLRIQNFIYRFINSSRLKKSKFWQCFPSATPRSHAPCGLRPGMASCFHSEL
jgi:hypothetical protein